MNFDWKTAYPSTRLPVFARNIVSTSHPLAAQAGLRMLQQGGNAVDARDRRGGRDDDRRAVQQRPRLGRVLHPLGRQAAARPERLGPGAGGLDARLLPAQVRRRREARRRCAAGIRSPCPAPSRGWVGAVGALRQAAVRRPARARDRDRRARLRACRSSSSRSGSRPRRCSARCRAGPRPSCRTAARPRSASASPSRPRRAR